MKFMCVFFSIKYRYSAIAIFIEKKPAFKPFVMLQSHLLLCNMVSVTSASRYITSASRYHPLIKVDPRCTSVV